VGLVRLAIVMLGDRAAAEDVVQDAVLGLYRHWTGLVDCGNALAYVHSAVLNRCRNALRDRDRPGRLAATVAAGESAEAAMLVGEEHQWVLAAIRAARPAARGPGAPVLPRHVRGRDRPCDGHQPRHGEVRHVPRRYRARPMLKEDA